MECFIKVVMFPWMLGIESDSTKRVEQLVIIETELKDAPFTQKNTLFLETLDQLIETIIITKICTPANTFMFCIIEEENCIVFLCNDENKPNIFTSSQRGISYTTPQRDSWIKLCEIPLKDTKRDNFDFQEVISNGLELIRKLIDKTATVCNARPQKSKESTL